MKKSQVFLAVLATILVAGVAGSNAWVPPTPRPPPPLTNPWFNHWHHGDHFHVHSHYETPPRHFIPVGHTPTHPPSVVQPTHVTPPPSLPVPVVSFTPTRSQPLRIGCTTSTGQMSSCQRAWYNNHGFPNLTLNPMAPGYQQYPGVGNYKVHRQGMSWDEALNVCASEGSILAVIDNDEEAKTIKNLIIGTYWHGYEVEKSGMYYYWIGAKEMGINMKFLTILGDLLGNPGYLKWSLSGNQPDNNGNNDCVGFMHDGTNFDADCNELKGFVCEKVT